LHERNKKFPEKFYIIFCYAPRMRDQDRPALDDPKLREKFAASFTPKKPKPIKPQKPRPKIPLPPKPKISSEKEKERIKKVIPTLSGDTSKDPNAPLTYKQRSFVNALVRDNQTKTAAAKVAGYTPNSACSAARELLARPKIQAAVAAERASYAIASGITKKMVVDGFIEAVDMARIKADPLVMIAGWREVGKLLGFYEPTKVSMSVSVTGQALLSKMNTLSDAELLEQIAEADLSNPDSIVSEQ
jgi:hypothetical protein